MANVWRNPIFDRTSKDIGFAIQKIAEWKNRHTHAADVKVVGDHLVVQEDGDAYIEDDSAILNDDGVAYVDDDVLIAQLGVVYDLKGCLNLSDINRIEDDITYLSTRLIQYRYSLDVSTKEWNSDSLPTLQDMKRIIRNIRSMFEGFVTPDGATPLPESMLSYADINAIERDLYLLKELFDAMVLSFVKSGTYKSGATMRLPIRR